MTSFAVIIAAMALLALNAPVAVLLLRLPFVADLKQVLQEKNPIGGADDTTSYSRVTGLVGAVIMTSFFWAMANIIIFKAFTAIGDIRPLIGSVQVFFLVGAAMFLPYAFNQIRSAFAAGPAAAMAVAKASATARGPAKGSTLSIAIANLSSAIDDAAFAAAVAAIGVQVNRDFQPEWGAGATLHAQPDHPGRRRGQHRCGERRGDLRRRRGDRSHPRHERGLRLSRAQRRPAVPMRSSISMSARSTARHGRARSRMRCWKCWRIPPR